MVTKSMGLFWERRLTRTPSGSEEENVEADEGDLGGDSRIVMLTDATLGNSDNSDDEFADQHTHGTPNEDPTTAVPLNDPE